MGLSVLCGRPLGFKSESENSDGRIDCDHVSGLLARHHDRWPRCGPRSSPKQSGGLEGRDSNRVLWIVGSTDRHLTQLFHPGINARSGVLGGCLSASPRVIVTHAVWAIRNSVPAETARRFNRLKLTKIEVTDRLQSFGDGAVS